MATIKHLPRRRVRVKGFGVLEVPRHIQRIDIEDPGKAGTHGWQVRWRGATKFFGDTRMSARRDAHTSLRLAAHTSLRLAARHLERIYDGPLPRLRRTEHKDKQQPLGIVGVRITVRKRANREIAETVLRVDAPGRSGRPKSVYVGTNNTITRKRLRAALARAKAIRARMCEDYVANLRKAMRTPAAKARAANRRP